MLLIGVVTSIFTAVVADAGHVGTLAGFAFMTSSRVMGTVGTGDRWKKYDFIGRRRWWFALSGDPDRAGAISLGVKGLNEGIDFTGGNKIDFTTTEAHTTDEMSKHGQPDRRAGAAGGRHRTQRERDYSSDFQDPVAALRAEDTRG